MPRRRAVVVVLDGLGAGDAPDTAAFGDEGANTLSNTAEAVGGVDAPNLQRLGLGNTTRIEGVPPNNSPEGAWGIAVEKSASKATLAGHWEMMGLIVEDALPTYPDGFPDSIIARFSEETGRSAFGNKPASGTEILEELGEEQRSSGDWIVYTSADSVFQIAANTEVIPLEELYSACEKAHHMLIGEGDIKVERVIARPYHGSPGAYEREHEHRHDYGIEPFSETYLDRIKAAGHEAVAVGKIRDIFDGKGLTRHLPAPPDDSAKVDAILEVLPEITSGFVFANLVDFDAKFGHRRDPAGMAKNIESFDRRLPEVLAALGEEDLLIITADHGNDPTFRGTDHTRELVPLLALGGGVTGELGVRDGFSDIGASVAAWLGVEQGDLPGRSFI
ncbi:MAG: phosphopentomutase [Rubrobacter sp.]